MKSNYDIAIEVLEGKWGNGSERKERLIKSGYNYDDVQGIVNALIHDGYLNKPEQSVTPDPDILSIDYDPQKYKGIQVNVIV
ncbi:MAG: hypothetical protein J6U97_06990 [Bacteroidaceae bacterium]|nr:hypothetical protein [Bacteroidaceae bacterium]